MANSQRQQRVQESLKETISEVIPMIRDPRLGFVTLTGVEVSPDLSIARVYFSAFGTEEEKLNSEAALKHAAGFVRREVAHRMQLRHTPELDFRLDRTPDRAERVMKILNDIEEEEKRRIAAGEISPHDEASGQGKETSNAR